MTTDPLRCVIDASVGIKLFVNEPGSNEAQELFKHLTVNPSAQFYVPDLFYIECASILWKYVRRLGLPPQEAKESIEDLAILNLRRVPTFDLMLDAFELTINQAVTPYDACYVALAHRLRSFGGKPTNFSRWMDSRSTYVRLRLTSKPGAGRC